MRKFFFEIFSPVTLLLKDLVSGAILTVKKSFFKTFLKRGSLEFAHIRSTCGPDLPEPAIRSDLMANFVKGYLGKKYGVRVILQGVSPKMNTYVVQLLQVQYLQRSAKYVRALWLCWLCSSIPTRDFTAIFPA